jgi:hypothetical protein
MKAIMASKPGRVKMGDALLQDFLESLSSGPGPQKSATSMEIETTLEYDKFPIDFMIKRLIVKM